MLIRQKQTNKQKSENMYLYKNNKTLQEVAIYFTA